MIRVRLVLSQGSVQLSDPRVRRKLVVRLAAVHVAIVLGHDADVHVQHLTRSLVRANRHRRRRRVELPAGTQFHTAVHRDLHTFRVATPR